MIRQTSHLRVAGRASVQGVKGRAGGALLQARQRGDIRVLDATHLPATAGPNEVPNQYILIHHLINVLVCVQENIMPVFRCGLKFTRRAGASPVALRDELVGAGVARVEGAHQLLAGAPVDVGCQGRAGCGQGGSSTTVGWGQAGSACSNAAESA